MNESQPKFWIALFSQTGSELVAICEQLGRYPDIVYTNNPDYDRKTSPFPNVCYMKTPSINNTLTMYYARAKNIVITLHGYLRILPKEVCELYEIYNGHPGDILNWPELKGKNPQLKALELGHTSARAVIHKVTPEVDDGEVVAVTPYVWLDTDASLDGLCEKLKTLSVIEWVKLLKEKL